MVYMELCDSSAVLIQAQLTLLRAHVNRMDVTVELDAVQTELDNRNRRVAELLRESQASLSLMCQTLTQFVMDLSNPSESGS
jgi:hypothetical protein